MRVDPKREEEQEEEDTMQMRKRKNTEEEKDTSNVKGYTRLNQHKSQPITMKSFALGNDQCSRQRMHTA
jgi:hypothetical protein